MSSSLLSRHTTTTPKTLVNVAATPSVHTDQQVDNAERQREREFRRASQSRSERWRLRSPNKREIVQRLQRLKHADAEKMAKCCSMFVARTCGQHTTKLYPTYRCKKNHCPDCAAERATRLSRQTEMKIAEVMKAAGGGRLCFLTLTMPNARTLDGGLKRLKRSFAAFKRKKAWKDHIRGYIGGYEYTYNPKTDDFHVHLHLIVLRGKFWNQSDISDCWREVTGDAFIVDIREIKDAHKGVKELAKYIVKSSDLMKMPDARFKEVVGMKKGTRMFVSGGCFYNVKFGDLDDLDAEDAGDAFSQLGHLKEGDNCPFCSEQLFDVFVSRDSAIGLYELNAMPGIVKRNSS